MSLGGWQQVSSPRYIGESMVAGGANCALGSLANIASLAMSVCQCHLGRAAQQYLFSAQWVCTHTSAHTRTHKLSIMHGCAQESKGRNVLHIHTACTQISDMTFAHKHTEPQSDTDSLPSVHRLWLLLLLLSMPLLVFINSLPLTHYISSWLKLPRHGFLCYVMTTCVLKLCKYFFIYHYILIYYKINLSQCLTGLSQGWEVHIGSLGNPLSSLCSVDVKMTCWASPFTHCSLQRRHALSGSCSLISPMLSLPSSWHSRGTSWYTQQWIWPIARGTWGTIFTLQSAGAAASWWLTGRSGTN